MAEAPFIKVGQQDLQVGYVGRDVEQIVRDLIEIVTAMEREEKERSKSKS